MGRLERRLDRDLIAKMANGWTPRNDFKPLKTQKPPRKASDYRGARRNAVLNALHDYRKIRLLRNVDKRDERGKWKEWWPGARPTHVVSHPPVRPNCSRKFDAVD